ncbi:MAG: oxidoreductase, partial [Xanthomonadales bacterium]|nr:oxidoreductase [Xanthomonadales bacterium]
MSDIPEKFNAFRIHDDSDGYRASVEPLGLDDLDEGEVTIRTCWSSV